MIVVLVDMITIVHLLNKNKKAKKPQILFISCLQPYHPRRTRSRKLSRVRPG